MKERLYKYLITFLIFLSGFLFYNMISFVYMPKLNTEDGFECAMIYNYAVVSNSALRIKSDICEDSLNDCKEELATCEER
tara:strand:- start:1095 stop:1334 length:240 start_codon:yes stop_codon:yes gene_type:complete